MSLDSYNQPTPFTKTFSSFNNTFGVVTSPVTLNANNTLGQNSVDGYIVNNGKGRLTYQISNDGSSFDDSINLEPSTGHNLTGISIDSIKITWVVDTGYEVVLW
tara:strand:- start:222 stop:533 length:312 start_codon:yes stop_codon:yes gene_type:complete